MIDKLPASAPRDLCRGLVVSIAAGLSQSLVDGDSFASVSFLFPTQHSSLTSRFQLCHLLQDPSLEVRKIAYELLREGAKKYTEKTVLEVEVDTTGDVKPSIPAELTDLLAEIPVGEDGEVYTDTVSIRHRSTDHLLTSSLKRSLPYLLSWMVAFDLFTDAVC